MNLLSRAEKRNKLVKLAKSELVNKASKLFLSLFRSDLEHLKPGDQVGPHIPIGKDKFVDWCKQAIEQFFPSLSGILENESMLKDFAVQTADLIGKSNTDVQNPMRDYEKASDPVFVRANKSVYIKKAQYTEDYLQSPVEPKIKSFYDAPTEHFRYDPENPGVQLIRVKDKEYRSPVPAGHNPYEPWSKAWNYKGSKDVKFETGVHNQTNHAWNDVHHILPFLSTKQEENRALKHKGKEYGYDREELYGVDTHWDGIPPKQRQDQREASSILAFTKTAQSFQDQFNAIRNQHQQQFRQHTQQQQQKPQQQQQQQQQPKHQQKNSKFGKSY